MQMIYVLLAVVAFWSCSTDSKKEQPRPDGSAAPVTTTLPSNGGGTFGPNKGFDEGGKSARSDSSSKSGKSTTPKPKTDNEKQDPKEDEDEEDKDKDDSTDKGSASSNNRFVKLQTEKCAKTSSSACKAYGLNAPRSKASFCPYTKTCAEGKCKLTEVLAHFCNCIYQLERGRTYFNGKEHDCVAEYQSALK
jgi:hypothetical protein